MGALAVIFVSLIAVLVQNLLDYTTTEIHQRLGVPELNPIVRWLWAEHPVVWNTLKLYVFPTALVLTLPDAYFLEHWLLGAILLVVVAWNTWGITQLRHTS